MHANSRAQLIAIKLGVFCSLGAVLFALPLLDYDLGWHLAGGLWIKDWLRFPDLDPFSSSNSSWVCYSWLFELAIAGIYDFGGFFALRVTQTLVIVLGIGFAVLYVEKLFVRLDQMGQETIGIDSHSCNPPPKLSSKSWSSEQSSKNQFAFRAELIKLFILTGLLLTASTSWYLRPQLISLLFFGFFIVQLESAKPNYLLLAVLTVIWANFHVYWIFSPLMVATYCLFSKASPHPKLSRFVIPLIFSALGLVNPYGTSLYRAVYNYAFNHTAAYEIIAEFRPLNSGHGVFFWLYWISIFSFLVGLFPRVGNIAQLRNFVLNSLPAILLFSIFSLAALLQVKYLPIYGLIAVLLASKITGPQSVQELNCSSNCNSESMIPANYFIYVILLVLIFLFARYYSEDSFGWITKTEIQTIPEKYTELFTITPKLKTLWPSSSSPAFVLNDFNSGGWLALAFYLQNRNSISAAFRTSIDGRTLVMGNLRLTEYRDLTERNGNECKILSHWSPNFAVLDKKSPLTEFFENPNLIAACNLCANKIFESNSWVSYQVKIYSASASFGSKISCAPAEISNLEITPQASSTTDSASLQ